MHKAQLGDMFDTWPLYLCCSLPVDLVTTNVKPGSDSLGSTNIPFAQMELSLFLAIRSWNSCLFELKFWITELYSCQNIAYLTYSRVWRPEGMRIVNRIGNKFHRVTCKKFTILLAFFCELLSSRRWAYYHVSLGIVFSSLSLLSWCMFHV